MLIGILEHKFFSKKALDLLNSLGKVVKYDGKNINIFLNNLDILFIRLNYFIGDEFLENCKNLKYICSPTTGLSHIDLKKVKKKNISLISLKGQKSFLKNIYATAEHTFCLILALLRGMNFYHSDIRDLNWNRMLFLGDELNNKKVGIIGFGRIGLKLSKYLDAFGAKVSWFDPYIKLKKSKFYRYKNLIKLIKENEIIILTASVENSNFILDEKEIEFFVGKHFLIPLEES